MCKLDLNKPGLRIQVGVVMSEEKTISIRLDLVGELAKEFTYVKRRKGIKNNSELVRLLIAQEYQRLEGRQV